MSYQGNKFCELEKLEIQNVYGCIFLFDKENKCKNNSFVVYFVYLLDKNIVCRSLSWNKGVRPELNYQTITFQGASGIMTQDRPGQLCLQHNTVTSLT